MCVGMCADLSLPPTQVIKLVATARMGISKEHAKWSPVSVATYRFWPETHLNEAALATLTMEQKQELVSPLNASKKRPKSGNEWLKTRVLQPSARDQRVLEPSARKQRHSLARHVQFQKPATQTRLSLARHDVTSPIRTPCPPFCSPMSRPGGLLPRQNLGDQPAQL